MAVGMWFMFQAKQEERKHPEREVNLDDYMMASKSVGVLPLAMSIVTSFMSAITVLGVPAELPTSNGMYIWFLPTFTMVCLWTGTCKTKYLFALTSKV